MCLGPVVFLDPDYTSPITQGWIRQVSLGSWTTTFRHWMTTCQSSPPPGPSAAAAQGLAHTFSMYQHLHYEEKILPSCQAQTSKKPVQSLSHLIGYCNNDQRLTIAKIRSLCPLHQVAVHKRACPATGELLTHFWLHGHFF